LDVVSFNNGCTCGVLNNRIIPGIAGYYQVNGQVGLNTLSRYGSAVVMIYKNGVEVSRGSRNYFNEELPGDPLISCVVSDLIYCNGTTDYLELYTSVSIGTSSIELLPSENYLTVEETSGTGPQGFSGYSGYSGAPFVGYSGYSGIVGTSGYSGFSSYSGLSGYSGTRGYSGYSGLSGLADDTLFNREINLGSGGNVTVYWDSGYKQFFTLTERACIKFTPPTTTPGWTADLTLRIYDTVGGGHSVGWPSNIMWEKLGEHNGPLTYFPGVSDYYLFRFYWDGQSSGYLGWYHGPFRTYSGTGCTCP
jgi:hypothetical protein